MSSEVCPNAAQRGAFDRRRRKLLAHIASSAGLASTLSACGGRGPDDEMAIRVVNATMDVASIDVHFNGLLFAGAVAYGGIDSGYTPRNLWAVGRRGPFEVRRAGGFAVLLRDTKTLPAGHTASLVVMGDLTQGLRLRGIDEETALPGTEAARLRLLHAWPLVGALDAFLTRADQPLAGREPDLRLGACESLSAYADVSGADRLRITPAGRTDLVLFDSGSTAWAANQVATLVVSPTHDPGRVAVTVLPQGLPAYALVNGVAASRGTRADLAAMPRT